MPAGWNKVSRKPFQHCNLVQRNIAIFLEPTRGIQTIFLGDVQAGRTARPFWSLLSIWWLSVIQRDVLFWSWIMFHITKAFLCWLPYRYSNIACWWFGCLLIAQNLTWSNDIGNIWKYWLVQTNCMTRSMKYWFRLNTCWCNRTIRLALFDCPFLNYFERLLR